jgi:hypothetical protein
VAEPKLFNTPRELEMRARAEKHSKEPVVGDYWHEMFSPVMIVTKVQKGYVLVCEKFKKHDDGIHLTPDYEASPRKFSRQEFYKYVHYDSESMADRTWCDVSPAKI